MPPEPLPTVPLRRSGWPLVLSAITLLGAVYAWASTKVPATLYTAAAAAVLILADLFTRLLRRARTPIVPIVVLFFLPAWGLAYDLGARSGCSITSCEAGETVFQPLWEPGVWGLLAFHLVTVLAFAVSRRRPEALRPAAEALVHAALLAGIAVHAVLAVHFARWLPVAVILAPVFLPAAAPVLTVVLYAGELLARLRRRGAEAAVLPARIVPDSAYREGPPQEPLPPDPRVHLPALARAAVLGPALLGVHAVLQALWLGRPDAALSVVTHTCGHVLSSIPIEVIPSKCHYLCTVAARGHTWLVKPERIGRRGGVPIVVNRQLALANAFEDLLHERWPRFGGLARRVYDRVGLPVSRYLRRPLLADLVYLAMKPAEWAFYTVLLLLDRGDPEARIDRMYR